MSSLGEFQPPDIEYDEEPACKHCGNQMDWSPCHMIDCEDGQYDLGEEDCINYDRGTYVNCQECNGKGGHWYCANKDCNPASPASAEVGGEGGERGEGEAK